MNVIETYQLTKRYRQTTVVDNISLEINKGEIYGLIGLNGAGKTTTMRMLLGMVKPSEGCMSLFGENIRSGNPNWKSVGYMVESTNAYPNLSVSENLKVFCNYYDLEYKNPISRVSSLLRLDRYKETKAKHLSPGNLQRLGLGKALLHEPELLILDEPVNGLDPCGIVEIRLLLKELSTNGTTILISSHLLGEISKIADTIGFIHHGVLIAEMSSEMLRERIRQKLVIDTTNNQKAISVLKRWEIEACFNLQNELEIFPVTANILPTQVAKILVGNRIGLKKLLEQGDDLESYFLRTLKRNNYEKDWISNKLRIIES